MTATIPLLALLSSALVAAPTIVLKESGKAHVGAMAPPFGAWDLAGKEVVTLGRLLKEKPARALLVTFGASWCAPCNLGLPRLIALEKAHAAELRVILVDVEGKADDGKAWVERLQFQGPVVHDKFEVTAKSYGLYEGTKLALPRSFLLTPKGRVQAIYREDGEDLEQLIEADLKSALAAPAAPEKGQPKP